MGEKKEEGKKKKLIKNKILTSPARLLLGASSSCARVMELQWPSWEDVPKAGYGKRLFLNTDRLNLYSLLNYILMHWLLWRCWDWLGLSRFGVSVPREAAKPNP